ncbi:MAG: SRPBCC domain-containing protein [Planctomycetaceae bacterium]|nr:SRPBCC domain-containing protein [Planctomycetaceae bacterium]
MQIRSIIFSLFVGTVLCVDPHTTARADVTDVTDAGYTVEQTYQTSASADKVWETLVKPSKWWNSSHTWSGKAENLSLDLKPGGGWDETLPDGGFVRHMSVLFCQPKKTLRLSGALGPMQEYPINGVLTVTLAEESGKTTVKVVYRTSGSFPRGLGKLAPVVDGVLKEQFSNLAKVAAQ